MVMSRPGYFPAVGIVIRIFEIDSLPEHLAVLPMVEFMTKDGLRTWKRRKLKVISESG
jgi:hypothetical protein